MLKFRLNCAQGIVAMKILTTQQKNTNQPDRCVHTPQKVGSHERGGTPDQTDV